ncbi:MAG TPA: hypothetical protein VHK47_24365 [Polyangia bacterium]|nr:hypothetical protein [Polyangia bacterium]
MTALRPPSTNRTEAALFVEKLHTGRALEAAGVRLERLAGALRQMKMLRVADDIESIAIELRRLSQACGGAPADAPSEGISGAHDER